MKKTFIILVIIIILVVLGWYLFSFQAEEPQTEIEDESEDVINDEAEDTEEEETEELSRQEEIYNLAEEVIPMGEPNTSFYEDLEAVWNKIFEKELKVVATGNIHILEYVAPRVITADDVDQATTLIDELENYTVEGVSAEGERYELQLSAEVAGEKYQGNVYIKFSTSEEGEEAQSIIVSIL